jgi:hypothetical protein
VLVILVRLTALERKTAENVVMPTEEGAPVKNRDKARALRWRSRVDRSLPGCATSLIRRRVCGGTLETGAA